MKIGTLIFADYVQQCCGYGERKRVMKEETLIALLISSG